MAALLTTDAIITMPHRNKNDDTLTGKTRHPKRILIRTALLSWLGIIFTVGIFVFSIFPYMKTQLIHEMDARARVIFTSISQVTISSILLEDYSSVVDHCITVVNENPSVLYAVITRHNGFSLVHTKKKWTQENLDGMWTPIKGGVSQTGMFLQSNLVNREVFHVSHPFSYSGVDWGWIHIGLSPDNFYIDLKALYIKTFWLVLLSISAGLLASYFFARRLTRPLLELDRLAQKVGAGDLSARIEISTDDELESLADSFNNMTGALQLSQKELKATHKKLIETARRMGMAEVATGVLHNVGNVLNSVGVTTSLIKKRVRESKVDVLARISDQFQEHSDDLSMFISSDDRGRKLPSLVSSLSEHMIEEKDSLLRELNVLTEYVDLIINIVNLQQSSSKVGGMTEPVSIDELVSDAVQISQASLTQQGVEIIFDFEDLPPILLDHHKVLQILINLIRNAEYALFSNDTENKSILVRVRKSDERHIRIEVMDNGVGIPKEDMTMIFSHGFTTKKDGHGFGLHSGALDAKAMGGTLSVHSDGSGKGATFTLELPCDTGEVTNE